MGGGEGNVCTFWIFFSGFSFSWFSMMECCCFFSGVFFFRGGITKKTQLFFCSNVRRCCLQKPGLKRSFVGVGVRRGGGGGGKNYDGNGRV